MKKTFMVASLIIVALLVGMAYLHAQPGRGMGPGYGYGYEQGSGEWNYCPYCGNEMGRGYGMRGPGYGTGHGMMHRGYDPMHRGWGPGEYSSPRSWQRQEPLKEKEATGIVEDYLKSTRNPNLKLGKITEKEAHFEVEIVTKDNSLVDTVAVDKYTGWMRSVY
ncbi:MAG: hypothetical protein RRA35_02545 [Desulfomonilia bacterium]|nr:hypothetical protein [Desulfomonilia bacterium]